MAAAEGVSAGKRALLELFRRSGTSTPGLQGKVVLGTVVPSNRRSDKFVEVDTGFKSPVAMTVEELQRAGCETHVGARVPVTVEYLRTPLGEMSVSAERARDTERSENIWEEIRSAHATGGLVKGRVLNPVNGGFAVGLAGLVAFMPRFKAPRTPRVGHLDWFEVMAVNPDTRNVVVASPRYDKLERALQAERHATSAAASASKAAEPRQARLQRSASGGGDFTWVREAASRGKAATQAAAQQQQVDGGAEKKSGRAGGGGGGAGEGPDAGAAAAGGAKKAAAPRAKKAAVKAAGDAEAGGAGDGGGPVPAAGAAAEGAAEPAPAKAPRKRAVKAKEGGPAEGEERGETPPAA